jgi:hypothetical protein
MFRKLDLFPKRCILLCVFLKYQAMDKVQENPMFLNSQHV